MKSGHQWDKITAQFTAAINWFEPAIEQRITSHAPVWWNLLRSPAGICIAFNMNSAASSSQRRSLPELVRSCDKFFFFFLRSVVHKASTSVSWSGQRKSVPSLLHHRGSTFIRGTVIFPSAGRCWQFVGHSDCFGLNRWSQIIFFNFLIKIIPNDFRGFCKKNRFLN